MLKIKGYHTSSNLFQKFFIERCMELLFNSTSGTYRVRVMNPLNILIEFRETLIAFKSGKISSFDYNIVPIKNEIKELLDNEQELAFKDFTKRYFSGKIMAVSKKTEEYDEVILLINKVIENNKKYLKNIMKKLKTLLDSDVNEEYEQFQLFEKIDRLSGYLITQFLFHGYSQRYLFEKFNTLFISQRNIKTFHQSWVDFERLESKKERGYVIAFKLNHYEIPDLLKLNFLTNSLRLQPNLNSFNFGSTVYRNKDISSFIQPKNHHSFGTIEVNAFDFHSALNKAKEHLSRTLDVINLAYHDKKIRLDYSVLVFEKNDNTKWDKIKYASNIDGFYDRGALTFDKFTKKIKTVVKGKEITMDTKEKIQSAIRYLRMANDSIELEHMFVNYWISIEHLYSFGDSSSAIKNLKTHLNASHGTVYMQKTLRRYKKIKNR